MTAMLASLGFIVGMAMAAQSLAAQMDGRYTIDSAKGMVKNSAKECWVTVGGVAGMGKCGDVVDSDADGVYGDKDQCPNTPAGVKVDVKGCALDSDGDGVPDYRDKCPDTRSGARVNSDGCEIISNVTIDLVNDEFDFDSARLKPAMKATLDDLADKVNASPGDESLEIIGHTDSVGTDAYNQWLSERRAAAVADYLAGRGVSSARMTTKGMGESQPIADNGTKEGRAKNRRVETQVR